MGVSLLRGERDGANESALCLLIILLLQINGSEIESDDPQALVNVFRAMEKRQRRFGVVVLPFDVPEIGQGLRICGIDFQLLFELLPGPVILLGLPIQIAQPEMHIWLTRRNLCRRLELADGLFRSAEPVKSLS